MCIPGQIEIRHPQLFKKELSFMSMHLLILSCPPSHSVPNKTSATALPKPSAFPFTPTVSLLLSLFCLKPHTQGYQINFFKNPLFTTLLLAEISMLNPCYFTRIIKLLSFEVKGLPSVLRWPEMWGPSWEVTELSPRCHLAPCL
jgi:hypothetical protein